jgi:hypothetical protein
MRKIFGERWPGGRRAGRDISPSPVEEPKDGPVGRALVAREVDCSCLGLPLMASVVPKRIWGKFSRSVAIFLAATKEGQLQAL